MGVNGLAPLIKKGTAVELDGKDKTCHIDLLGLFFCLIASTSSFGKCAEQALDSLHQNGGNLKKRLVSLLCTPLHCLC
jgi:hypothetical protein